MASNGRVRSRNTASSLFPKNCFLYMSLCRSVSFRQLFAFRLAQNDGAMYTGLSKASATKRNVTASPIDDAVVRAMHNLVAICLQFQLYPLLFVLLIIVLGFWAVAP